ncbi:MAG: hypothetical protein IT256_03000 [Chitinophagaceae bacterium]|nr:hypothetical protein [Chitinophagaceae bacterium]
MEKNTLLHRQVNPSFVQAECVSSQVFSVTSQTFKPTPKDNLKLSVYNGEKYTAEDSFAHFKTQGYQSAGVLSLEVSECDNESLPVVEDNHPFDGHTYVDFNALTNSAIEKKAKKLKKYALDRGWQHSPIK